MKIAAVQKSGFQSFLEGLGEVLEAMAESSAQERRKEEARKQFLARAAGDVDQMRFELMQFKQELMKMEAQNTYRMNSEERSKLYSKKEELKKMIRMYENALRSAPSQVSSTPEIRIYSSRREKLESELFELKKEKAILTGTYGKTMAQHNRLREIVELIGVYEKELGNM